MKVFIIEDLSGEEVQCWSLTLLIWLSTLTIIYNNRGKEGSGAITH